MGNGKKIVLQITASAVFCFLDYINRYTYIRKEYPMITYKEYTPTAGIFNNLTDSVGWGTRDENVVTAALKNSLYCLCAFDGDEIIGFARLIGDETIFLYVQDVMVKPEYQGKGIGRELVSACIGYIKSQLKEGWRIKIVIVSAKGKEGFYEKFGFQIRPNENDGAGMQMWCR